MCLLLFKCFLIKEKSRLFDEVFLRFRFIISSGNWILFGSNLIKLNLGPVHVFEDNLTLGDHVNIMPGEKSRSQNITLQKSGDMYMSREKHQREIHQDVK